MAEPKVLKPLWAAKAHCKPATETLVKLMSEGKARRMEILEDKCGVLVERWLVGKHTGILFATPDWWDFYAPIVPVSAVNATLSAIEHMAEAE